MRAALTLLLIRRREKSLPNGGAAVAPGLLPSSWLLALVVLADAAADRNPTLKRLHAGIALPWRIAGGALAASSAASSFTALPGYALVGDANALLWQRAWRDGRHELERLGVQAGPVAFLEYLSVLWLTTLSRR